MDEEEEVWEKEMGWAEAAEGQEGGAGGRKRFEKKVFFLITYNQNNNATAPKTEGGGGYGMGHTCVYTTDCDAKGSRWNSRLEGDTSRGARRAGSQQQQRVDSFQILILLAAHLDS